MKIVRIAVIGKKSGEVCLMVRKDEIGEIDFLIAVLMFLFVIL